MDLQVIGRDYEIRKLNKTESIQVFDCGDKDLNDFILNESIHYRNALLAVSYVFERKEANQAVGYFSLANDRISIADFENKTEFNRFRKHRFINEKRLKSYPAAKICRLGVDISMKGQSIGTFLLDFIKSFFGSPAKVRVYAYNFVNLKRKNFTSTTPLSCALNALILALNDSAAALVDLRS